MLPSPWRRSAVAATAFFAAAMAPLALPAPAGAATSNVTVSDPTGDPKLASNSLPTDEPKADITAASTRYQNNHITLTMKLAKGDDLSGSDDMMFWSVGAKPSASPDFIVEFKKGSNGFGQAVVSVPGDDPLDCPGTTASFDVAAAKYTASVPAACVGSPASFQWNAQRRVSGAVGGPASDIAPDDGLADAVTPGIVSGYWAIGSDGKVYNFGDAEKMGEPTSPANPIIDIEAAPHGAGYWAVDEKGAVTAFGPGPVNYGSVAAADLKAGEKAVSISGTPTSAGYWVFTNQGRVFAAGDANKNLGDVSKIKLNGEILDSAPTPSGKGYYLVGADGGVFALGDATYEGSMGNAKLNQPVQAIVPDPDGTGYWLVASDGGVFAFNAPFRGSTGDKKLNKPITGMVPYGNGYLMVAEDGGVFNFSDKPFSGSIGNNPPANPIVSITALS